MAPSRILPILIILALAAGGVASTTTKGAERGRGLTPMDRPAPDFTLPDPDGETLKLSGLRGKAVIINFWATWCPPCRAEMPSLQRAWNALKDSGGHVLAIHVGGDADQVWDFMARDQLDFPVAIDGDSKVINQWPVKGLPTTFIVAPDGRIAYRAIGGREWDDPEILEAVRALVKR